jgi:hypothetical protein
MLWLLGYFFSTCSALFSLDDYSGVHGSVSQFVRAYIKTMERECNAAMQPVRAALLLLRQHFFP